MKKSINLTVVIIFFLSVSCSSNSQRSSSRGEIESFDHFYSRFYTDSAFQIERIVFPLAGYNSDLDLEYPDDIAEQLGVKKEDFFWNKETWAIIGTAPENDELIRKQFEKSDTLVTEELKIPDSGFRIIRRFKSIEGKWYLNYYFYQDI